MELSNDRMDTRFPSRPIALTSATGFFVLVTTASTLMICAGPDFGMWYLAPCSLLLLSSALATYPLKRFLLFSALFNWAWSVPLLDWLRTTNGDSILPWRIEWLMAEVLLTCWFTTWMSISWYLVRHRQWSIAVAFPLSHVLAEESLDILLRATMWTTVEPIRLALTQSGVSPLRLTAVVGGTVMVTWIVATIGSLVYATCFSASVLKCRLVVFTCWASVALVCVGALSFYAFHNEEDLKPICAAVCPSAGMVHCGDLELAALVDDVADIVVWPECAVSNTIVDSNEPPTYEELVGHSLNACGVVGVHRVDAEHVGVSNSAVVYEAGVASGFVDKRFLCPFLECQPPLAGWIGVAERQSLRPAFKRQVHSLDTSVVCLGIGICHDALFPEWSEEVANECNLLIHMANETMATATSPHRRATACCQFRAIESCRSLVRATRNGESCHIDYLGRCFAGEPVDDGVILYKEVALSEATSPVLLLGKAPVYGILALLVIFSEIVRVRRGV